MLPGYSQPTYSFQNMVEWAEVPTFLLYVRQRFSYHTEASLVTLHCVQEFEM